MGFSHPSLPQDAVKLLAPSGQQLSLRHDMRQPFAAWLARQACVAQPQMGGGRGSSGPTDQLRRYEIAWVHRSARGRALPSTYLQADMDILTPPAHVADSRDRLLAEAESIKCLTQVRWALLPFCGVCSKYHRTLNACHGMSMGR